MMNYVKKVPFCELLLLGALLACKGSKEQAVQVTPAGEAPTPTVTAAAATKKTPAKPVVTAAKMGDTVTFDDSTWTVTKFEVLGNHVKSGNQFIEDLKSEGGKFVRVTFKVTNLGNKEQRIFAEPKVKDSKAREFGQVDSMAMFLPKGKKSIQLEAIPPSIAKEFIGIYEIAGDSEGLQFMARELGFGSKTHPVDLTAE